MVYVPNKNSKTVRRLKSKLYKLFGLIILGSPIFSCEQNPRQNSRKNKLITVEAKGYVVPKTVYPKQKR